MQEKAANNTRQWLNEYAYYMYKGPRLCKLQKFVGLRLCVCERDFPRKIYARFRVIYANC